MTKQDLNYWMMYHEVHHLKRQGCSIRKISEELVLNFRTVRKYLPMSDEEFFKHLEVQGQRYKKLSLYGEYVNERLGHYPETRSAQMHDWLKENYIDFPPVCEKTVFNFVLYVRQKYNIPQQHESRQFYPIEELSLCQSNWVFMISSILFNENVVYFSINIYTCEFQFNYIPPFQLKNISLDKYKNNQYCPVKSYIVI